MWDLCRQTADELPVIAMRTAKQAGACSIAAAAAAVVDVDSSVEHMSVLAVFDECELVGLDEHRKKYNLCNDPSSWLGHSCLLRTRERTVAVIAMRRKCTNAAAAPCCPHPAVR